MLEAFEDIEVNEDIKKDIIIDNLMKSEDVYLIVSPPKVGKSLFALQLANSIANGKPFMGHEVLKPSPVLYVTTEMSNSQIKQRCMLLDIDFNKKNFFTAASFSCIHNCIFLHLGNSRWNTNHNVRCEKAISHNIF